MGKPEIGWVKGRNCGKGKQDKRKKIKSKTKKGENREKAWAGSGGGGVENVAALKTKRGRKRQEGRSPQRIQTRGGAEKEQKKEKVGTGPDRARRQK